MFDIPYSREKVLSLGREEVLRLSRANFSGRYITQEEVTHIFYVLGAHWAFDYAGSPTAPHAVTTKDECTDGFVDTLRVLKYTRLCDVLAYELVKKVSRDRKRPEADWVIGSDHAGATLSFMVGHILGAIHEFTEKGPDKTQLWKRHAIETGQMVLQVEELITTTSTLQAVRTGIREGNRALGVESPVEFLPFSLTLVHRSPVYTFEDTPIYFLVHYDINTWEQSECPHCKNGSPRIVEPKKHWRELTGA